MSFIIWGFTVSWPLVGALLVIIICRELWNMTYISRLGLNGPRPWPFLGSFLDMKKGIHFAMLQYQKVYGTVLGFYMFRNPIVVVSDPEMIKDITVKSFTKLMNHQEFILKNRPLDQSVSVLRDQHWKNVRNIITPTFSALKMKQMSGLLNDCCDLLVRNCGQSGEKGDEINIIRVFEAFTMDGIAKCAFGLRVDSQNDPQNPFVAHAKEIVSGELFTWPLILSGIFPPFGHLMNALNIGMFPHSTMVFFTNVVNEAIAMRKQSGNSERKDFLQLMINAHEDEVKIVEGKKPEDHDLHDMIDEHHDKNFFEREKSTTKLTQDEILGQAFLFFIGGYETTNITLSFIAYSLATNPEIQDKLIEEVDELAPTRDSVNYNTIAKMPYLDGVVCETLRLYPAAALTDRECNETYTYNGVTIPKGAQVFLSIFALHRNPVLWPEPDTFDPTRFSKKNREGRHPFAWMPFGAGPRNCIGMRFALMEIKMAVVRLLQKYRFDTSPCTQVPVKLGVRSVKPEDGIFLRVVVRNKD